MGGGGADDCRLPHSSGMTYRSLISEVCRIHYRAGIDEEAKREASRIHIYFFLTAAANSCGALLRVVVVLDAPPLTGSLLCKRRHNPPIREAITGSMVRRGGRDARGTPYFLVD